MVGNKGVTWGKIAIRLSQLNAARRLVNIAEGGLKMWPLVSLTMCGVRIGLLIVQNAERGVKVSQTAFGKDFVGSSLVLYLCRYIRLRFL